MNPIDILGGMLGRKSGGTGRSGGSLGGSILESILKGKTRGNQSSSGSSGSTAGMQRPAGSPTIRPRSSHEEFDSLEDLLRHAHQSSRQRRNQTNQQQQPFPELRNERIQRRQSDFNDRFNRAPAPFNDTAKILVIAMINAAKSDGQIDQKEQDAIVKELGDLSQEEVQFLKSEFAKPLDVKEFAWSVPLGMEQQVYAVSLIAIDLDRQAEANYLKQLGHGFRMTQESCNQIHKEFNAPEL